ncbi:hypothetical protein CY35_15G057700 [Sphagnum magellanicum]|nr:hypothetical protein CY35_15G057700 [Sphagnum magellanicum]
MCVLASEEPPIFEQEMEENGVDEASEPFQEDIIATMSAPHNKFFSPSIGNGDSCLNGRDNNLNKKRSRSAPWSVSEMLTLIDAKKEERERCHSYKIQGVKLPAAEKWRIVATHMETKSMERSGSQCQDKWENMMKDYKVVREWQFVGGGGAKNYFRDMTNKERKDASLPPQMDEIVFSNLHAIQNEKEEKKDKAKWKDKDCKQQPPSLQVGQISPPLGISLKDKIGSSGANDMESMDTNSSTKRKRRKKLQQHIDLDNHAMINDFVHAMKDGSKDFIDCLIKVLEQNDKRQEVAQMENKPKDIATLARVLVTLSDAVKLVAQKL